MLMTNRGRKKDSGGIRSLLLEGDRFDLQHTARRSHYTAAAEFLLTKNFPLAPSRELTVPIQHFFPRVGRMEPLILSSTDSLCAPENMPTISVSVSVAPQSLLQPSNELYAASLFSAKNFLDPLASSISRFQTHRLKVNTKKRKRSAGSKRSVEDVLRLRSLYVDGFAVAQIWEQAMRIVDATREEIQRDFPVITAIFQPARSPHKNGPLLHGNDRSTARIERSDVMAAPEDTPLQSIVKAMSSSESESENEDQQDSRAESDLSDIAVSAMATEDEEPFSDEGEQESYVQDPFGLNDGFFSIDDFNKQTEYFERQDTAGTPDDNEASDEEIDWHTDPSAHGKLSVIGEEKNTRKGPQHDDDQASMISEDERMLGDINPNGYTEDDEISDPDVATTWLDTNDIKYADFFAPPPRKSSIKKTRQLPKTQPPTTDFEDNLERAIADVRRDLFEDHVSDEDVEFDRPMFPDDRTGPSSHEKQRARIADEIRRLEAANVAKKEWMLAGEAKAVERPLNSLIENDLDFERIGKPVPVVTNETSEEIEQLVKRRILAKEFDEVIRRLPASLSGDEVHRGRPEVDEIRPQQSLAELYEADHLRANDPGYVDQKDQKLRREHAEISQLWKEISSQLDSLSNWHYKPKVPQPNISTVADIATITMEEARPTTGGLVGGQGTLAPQEIYNPANSAGFGGEIVLKSGASVARHEMTREEKIRTRRRQRQMIKKTTAAPGKSQNGSVEERKRLIGELKKGGVKVLGDKGQLETIDGQMASASGRSQGDKLKL
jgi:U3 small nucleolar RNA-associated protein MPP10